MSKYIIKFKALPDASVAVKNQPTFYYTVSVDVTDVNGETRSAETEVAVGYHSLNLAIQSKDKIEVSTSKFTHHVLRKPDHNYFDLLREKLKFGQRD